MRKAYNNLVEILNVDDMHEGKNVKKKILFYDSRK